MHACMHVPTLACMADHLHLCALVTAARSERPSVQLTICGEEWHGDTALRQVMRINKLVLCPASVATRVSTQAHLVNSAFQLLQHSL